MKKSSPLFPERRIGKENTKMPKGIIFRKTPFNGYNRDDVLEYMKKQDEKTVRLEAETAKLKEEKAQQEADIERLTETIAFLKATATETSETEDLSAECEKLKEENLRLTQEIENRDGMIAVLDDMNTESGKNTEKELETLRQDYEKLKQELEIKNGEIEKLQADIREKDSLSAAEDAFAESGENGENAGNNGSETDEILKSAKIKSDYMIKNAEYYAFSTKEKLSEIRKAIDGAMQDIEKSMESATEYSKGGEN